MREGGVAHAGKGEDGCPEVFISYASRDVTKALAVADYLAACGWSVWIDRWRLLGGASFRRQIERAVRGARVVVVLWSEASVQRDWVAAEARIGRERNALASARLDGATPPLPFEEYQIRDLREWDGRDREDAGLRALTEDVAHVLGRPAPEVAVRAPPLEVARSFAALGPMVAAALFLVMILVWLVFRLGVPTPVAFGVPIFVSILGFLVRAKRIGERLSELVTGLCGRVGLSVLGVMALGLGWVSSVEVTGPPAGYYPLGAWLVTGAGEEKVLREAQLTAARRWVRWLVVAPPWGRALRVKVEGHDDRLITLAPWRGASLGLGEDLTPCPVVLIRVDREMLSLVNESELRIEHEGAVLASVGLGDGTNAVLVGGGCDLEALGVRWREGLGGWPGPVERVVAGWGRPVEVSWDGRAPALDAEVAVELKTGSGNIWSSEPFRLRGAFTDEEPRLRR